MLEFASLAPTYTSLALNYTLTQDIDTAVPPGDPRMLRLALSIIGAQGGQAVPLDSRELSYLRKEAARIKEKLF
jgi:hypothetical protein